MKFLSAQENGCYPHGEWIWEEEDRDSRFHGFLTWSGWFRKFGTKQSSEGRGATAHQMTGI